MGYKVLKPATTTKQPEAAAPPVEGMPQLVAHKGSTSAQPQDTTMPEDVVNLLSYGQGSVPTQAEETPSERGYRVLPTTKGIYGSPTLQALGHGYGRGATLGLFDPALAGVAALFNRDPGETMKHEYQQALKYFLEQAEAEKREHPVAAGTGEALSYLGPTGAGSMFKLGAKGGTKLALRGGEGALARHLLRPALQTGLGFGTAEASRGLVEGTLGEGGFDPIEGLKEAAVEGGKGTATGAVVGPAFHGLGKLIKAMAKPTATKLTGTDYEALRKWAVGQTSGGQKMSDVTREAVRKFPELADELAAIAKGGNPIPEYAQAMEALSRVKGTIPSAKMEKAIQTGIQEGQMMGPKHEGEVKLLQKWLQRYVPAAKTKILVTTPQGAPIGRMKSLRATGAEKLKKALQADVDYARLSHDTPYYDKVLKKAAAALREDLRKVPQEAATEYGAKMDVVAKKMQAIQGLREYLGKKAGKLEINAERLLKDAARNPEKMNVLRQLDAAFGTDYGTMAEGIGVARQLGGQAKAMSEVPQLFSTYRTGAFGSSMLPGMILGGGGGHMLSEGLTVPAILSVLGGVGSSSPLLWAEGIKGAGALAPYVGGVGSEGVQQYMTPQQQKNKERIESLRRKLGEE